MLALSDSDKQFAFGVNGGSRGAGFDLVYQINDNFNLRGSYSQYDISESFEEDDIDYDGEFELNTTGVMLDYYPFSGAFRLSAGYFNNGTGLAASAQAGAAGTVDINGVDYDITNEFLDINMDWDSSTSYIGLGWGNSLGEGSNWTVTFDLGILLTGEPNAKLTASDGLHAANPDLIADIAAEEASLNEDLSDFNKYPVLQLGLTYAF